MSCEKYFDSIEDLVEAELDVRETARVNLHIFACSDCRIRFEALKMEKSFYTQYLFEIEPAKDLWKKVEAELDSPALVTTRKFETTSSLSNFGHYLFQLLGFRTVFGSAVLLIILGTIYFNSTQDNYNKNDRAQRHSTGGNSGNLQKTFPQSSENVFVKTDIASVKNSDLNSAKTGKSRPQSSVYVKNIKKTAEQPIKKQSNRTSKTGKQAPVENSLETSAASVQIGEDSNEFSRIKKFELEAAEQIEKVELLLRAFRNARADETEQKFDIAYEKQLAGKLLENNVHLRRGAESLGAFYAKEILSKLEPLLLDISNLENSAESGKILDIKERLKNQNIIASLQTF